MDKGTKTFTGFDLDEDLIDFRMSNPESLKWKMGLIHSHNTMNTFFSGTDMEELNDTSEFHNYYLSLIVNNFMDMTAKVAFRGKTNGFTCKNENGEDWTLSLTSDREILFTFECDIKTEKEEIKVEKTFRERVDEIIEKAKKKVTRTVVVNPTHTGKSWQRTPTHKSPHNSRIKQTDFSFDKPLIDLTKKAERGSIEDFARYVLRLGDDSVANDTLENALEDLSVVKLNITQFTGSIMEKYASLFEKYWDDFMMVNTDDMQTFINVTEEVVMEINEYSEIYDFIEPIETTLNMLVHRLTFQTQ